jgi:hypothetical protein
MADRVEHAFRNDAEGGWCADSIIAVISVRLA